MMLIRDISSVFSYRKRLLLMRLIIPLSLCFCFCSSVESPVYDQNELRIQRQTTKGSSALEGITDDFSILARLVNAISLQDGLSDGTVKPDDLIAELLDLESATTVRDLLVLTLDTNGISSKLDTMLEDVSRLDKNPLTDSSKVKEAVSALRSMQDLVDDLKANVDATLLDAFINESQKITIVYEPDLNDIAMRELADGLKAIKDNELEVKKPKSIAQFNAGFEAIAVSIGDWSRMLAETKSFSDHPKFNKLWSIKNKYLVLKPIKSISQASQMYIENWATFSSISEKMSYLKTDFGVLKPMMEQHEFHSTLSESFKPINNLIKGLTSSKGSMKLLTEGLPNGPSDLNRIKDDLKGKWLKEKIANGKDLTKLASSLKVIEATGTQFSKLNEIWAKFKESKASVDLEFMKTFTNLGEDGRLLKSNSNMSVSLTILTEAMKNLKQANGSPSFEEFDKLYDCVENINTNIVDFESALQRIVGIVNQDIYDDIDTLKALAEAANRADVTLEEVSEAVKKMKDVPNIGKITELATIAADKMKPLFSRNFHKLIKTKLNWKSIEPIQKSLEGTGLPEVLEKLKTGSVDFESIDKVLGYGIKVRDIKNDKVQSLKSVLTSIDQLKSEVKKTEDSLGSKSRRRRESGAIKQLPDSKTLAVNLGRGVNLLRKLVNVYNQRNVLLTAAGYPPEVHDVIISLPALKSVWTDQSRKIMLEFPSKLEELEKYAKEHKDDKDLIQAGKIFSKASELQGIPIDSQLFADPAVPALQKSHRPSAQSAAPAFMELSKLELDYSKHSATIKSASLTLAPLREYFDEIFGITRTQSGVAVQQKPDKKEDEKGGISWEALIYIISGVAFVAGSVFLIIWLLCKCRRDRKYYQRLRDPETWVLLSYTRENEPQEFGAGHSIAAHELIMRKNLGAFKKCLKNGAYVDAKVQSWKQGNTMLHEAVIQDEPGFIEALIKHGATREILNHDQETPLELAKRLKKKKCIQVFKKFEKKTFKIVLPEPFSKHNYMIAVDGDIPREEHYHADFFKKYQQYQVHSSKRPSHYVVKTDKHNVFHVSERHLQMVFGTSMMMGHRWLKACIDNGSKITNNEEYRVTKMQFQGKIYETVLQIKDFVNRMNIPYMYGIGVYLNNHFTHQDWITMRKIITQLGVFDGTGEFPFTKYKHGACFYRDDLPRNFMLYKPNERTQIELNFKEWCDHKSYVFVNTDELTHFLLAFKIKSKKLQSVEKTNKAIQNGVKKDQKKQNKKTNKKDDSEASNSGPEDSNSGPSSTMTKTPTSKTQTPNSVTPTSRTPGTTRRH